MAAAWMMAGKAIGDLTAAALAAWVTASKTDPMPKLPSVT
jgi:hypothetical protein